MSSWHGKAGKRKCMAAVRRAKAECAMLASKKYYMGKRQVSRCKKGIDYVAKVC